VTREITYDVRRRRGDRAGVGENGRGIDTATVRPPIRLTGPSGRDDLGRREAPAWRGSHLGSGRGRGGRDAAPAGVAGDAGDATTTVAVRPQPASGDAPTTDTTAVPATAPDAPVATTTTIAAEPVPAAATADTASTSMPVATSP
jgi:hypothetical protein